MIREIPDHGDRCTWHDLKGERCGLPAELGSARTALCPEHVEAHGKLTMEPEAYASWKANRDAARHVE